MKLTFLLPGNSYSGGVRVTMQMGNHLLGRGHSVRIAYPRNPLLSRVWLMNLARSLKLRCQGISETRWLSNFKGELATYASLDDLDFDDNEVVIATGIHTIEELQGLRQNVRKVRYCHGLLEQEPEHIRKMWLWSGTMNTIACTPALVPTLEKFCEGRVLGVVPNGICLEEYFVEDSQRDGVGFIYNANPVKGPEVAIALSKVLQTRFPDMPCRVFGSCPRPSGLIRCEYTRYPSIERARALYNGCKIWLITSRDEGFCLPILEAMACGCAVISSRHTNSRELIQEGVNGFTVPYGDVESYLEVVGRLINDESLRNRIVEAGLQTVKQFTWENAADRMEELLFKLKASPDVQSS